MDERRSRKKYLTYLVTVPVRTILSLVEERRRETKDPVEHPIHRKECADGRMRGCRWS